jgi:DNA ligase (NAD+)
MTQTADNPQTIALIQSLNKQVLAAQAAYYSGEPILSDAEYDTLEARLKGIVQSSPWLAEHATSLHKPGDAPLASGRVKHIRPMLSIENKYTKPEITEFFLTLPTPLMLAEPKRDGISCELRYRDGHLVQALSRGSGTEGEDMTAQVKVLLSIPKTLLMENTPGVYVRHSAFPADTNVRGELVMRKSELERINKAARAKGEKEYASTRNLTAGTMKLKDLAEVAKREIMFIPWEVYGSDDAALPDSGYTRMLMLAGVGFAKYEGFMIDGADNVIKVLDHILAENKQSDVIADGVVVKADSHKDRARMGNGSKVANYQVCFKPQSASGTTYLRSIEWQVGRQGKLTPVATCDPVPLAGAMVTRATLNNITWIDAMGLKLGAKVEMLRSGDVIPQIVKVIDEGDTKIVPPTVCPECFSKLEVLDEERSGIITHWCQNYECVGRVRDLFSFISSRDVLEIDNLGPEMATKIVTGGYARDIGELFEFHTEAMATFGEEAFITKMRKKGFDATLPRMLRSMEKAKKAPWERWIACLGIPMIGRTLGKVLAAKLKLDAQSMQVLPNLLASLLPGEVEGIGDVKLDMIHTWAKEQRNVEICITLSLNGIQPTNTTVATVAGEPLKGVAFCITGEFTEDRDSIAEKLTRLGGVSKSGVTSKCNLLIVGDSAGKTKLSKATQLGIKQVGKEWLVQTLTENGMELKGNGGFEPEEA